MRHRHHRLAVYLRMPIAVKLALDVMNELEHDRTKKREPEGRDLKRPSSRPPR